ncbi:MAG: hypothetical protein LUG13_07910 [Oscillospiraceae bacterium]|nr:hypothetical protein [Oscillospiraceae bacterium]
MQDGLGYSALSPAGSSPLADVIDITGFDGFPAGTNGTDLSKFSGGVYDGNGGIWLIPASAGQVVRLDTATGEMTGCANWPAGFDPTAQYKFRSGVLDAQGNVWLIPSNADQVMKLDTQTGTMTGYASWPSGFNASQTAKFYGGVYHDGSIWLVPSNADRVIAIDTATGAMTGYADWPTGFDLSSVKFIGGVKDEGGSLWMIPCNANMLVKLELSTGTMTGYDAFPSGISATDTEKFAGGISDAQGNFWMVPNNAAAAVKVNPATGAMTGYADWPSGISGSDSNKFSGGAFDGKYIWLAPQFSNVVVKLDPASGNMTSYNFDQSDYTAYTSAKFIGGVFDGNNIWFVPYRAEKVMRVANGFELSLAAPETAMIYAPDNATIEVNVTNYKHDSAITHMEYFRLNTTDTASVTTANFANYYSFTAAENKGTCAVSATAQIPADQNGTYWVRATVEDSSGSYAAVEKITIRSIYSPCLYVKGVDTNGTVLYEKPYGNAHGIPLDNDNSLIASPALGFETVTVAAESLTGYAVTGTASYTVTLDSASYLNQSGSVLTFTYRPVAQTGDAIPTETPSAEEAPSATPPESPPPESEPPPPSEPPAQAEPEEIPPSAPSIAAPGREQTSSPVYQSEAERLPDNTIVFSLKAIANQSDKTVYRYTIFDMPSSNLTFLSGQIPAFTKGDGLSYAVLYKTNTSNTYQVIASGVSAAQPYTVAPPQLGETEYITELTLSFDAVPAGFAENNVIYYTFLPSGGTYSNEYYTYWNSSINDRSLALSQLDNTLNDLLQDLSEGDYSPESWQHLMAVMRAAQEVLADPYATAAQLDAAYASVNEAINGLQAISETNAISAQTAWLAILLVVILVVIIWILWMKRRKKNRAKTTTGS